MKTSLFFAGGILFIGYRAYGTLFYVAGMRLRDRPFSSSSLISFLFPSRSPYHVRLLLFLRRVVLIAFLSYAAMFHGLIQTCTYTHRIFWWTHTPIFTGWKMRALSRKLAVEVSVCRWLQIVCCASIYPQDSSERAQSAPIFIVTSWEATWL